MIRGKPELCHTHAKRVLRETEQQWSMFLHLGKPKPKNSFCPIIIYAPLFFKNNCKRREQLPFECFFFLCESQLSDWLFATFSVFYWVFLAFIAWVSVSGNVWNEALNWKEERCWIMFCNFRGCLSCTSVALFLEHPFVSNNDSSFNELWMLSEWVCLTTFGVISALFLPQMSQMAKT